MDRIKKYLRQLLTEMPKYPLSIQDQKMLVKNKALWITQKLARNNFRRGKITEKNQGFILKQVESSLSKEGPIYLIACFGGYKHYWNPSHPFVDWAEFFNLDFMCQYMAPILKVYPPGIILEYESEDVIIPLIDNYPPHALDDYMGSFKKLIQFFSAKLPKNFIIRTIRCQEQYDSIVLFKRIQELFPQRKKQWDKLPPEIIAKKTHRTPASIMWKGDKDWTKLNEKERQKKIIESKILNEIFYDVDFELRPSYFDSQNHIPLVFSWGIEDLNIDNWLTLGSTKASFVDFWIGRGILEDRETELIPRILSHTQYDAIKDQLESVSVNLLPVPNFDKIEVYKGKLNF
jgi:hypothetical protein